MTFTEFQACLYFLTYALPSETPCTQFWEHHRSEIRENVIKVLIFIYQYIYIYI